MSWRAALSLPTAVTQVWRVRPVVGVLIALAAFGCTGPGDADDAAAGDDGAVDDEPATDEDAAADGPGTADAGEDPDAVAEPDDEEDAAAEDVASDEPPAIDPAVDQLEAARVTIEREGGGRVEVAARLAADGAARQRGLMGVEELPDGAGMLFTWDGGEREGGFWMKDTLISLDIAFAGRDGRIEAILTMLPCETDPCPTYDPQTTYVAALEVPGGWFEDNDVEVGDRLTWARIDDR